ncbi:DUF2911 domain-containing protein [Flagellimonas meridianipacifica]|uniref:Tetratricopeptide repeat protein n=1 Tax=Flagellimonas meridianipacifica TaxID=1080225 RepID=A0A2T0MBP4_9FLAO|nr:DUF2911 domain-containing protein [Allomuricauda pacifica]PRX54924.1 tetratricopeptide repeat protein [Allomuricauda pacifica]
MKTKNLKRKGLTSSSKKAIKSINTGLLVLLVLTATYNLNAQHFNIHNPLTLPDKSPQSIIKQRIGYTDVTISYHSPGTKGREIWGKLVPYGKVWRAGANENTVITITDKVQIGGQELEAGSYGLHLLPEADEWTFIFSDNHTSWGSYFYNKEEDALRITVPVKSTGEHREWMSFDFNKRERDSFSIVLGWADKQAELEFTLDIDNIALEHIREQLRSDAYWEWFSWCQAADYCAEYGINTEEALQWIEQSIKMQENFSNWDVKAKLLKQFGDEAGAELAIQRAIEVGSAIYLERYGRRLMREEKFDRAEYVFGEAIKKDKAYWRAHFNRGNALIALKNSKQAKSAFEKALELAPQDRKEQVLSSIKSIE